MVLNFVISYGPFISGMYETCFAFALFVANFEIFVRVFAVK